MGSYKWGCRVTIGPITLLITTLNFKPLCLPLYPYRIPIDPFKGALKGTLITAHEPPRTPGQQLRGSSQRPSVGP